jgi:AcrR family transcriptional regulator
LAARGPARRRPRPKSRDRIATRARILDAVGVLLAREGFSGLGVNAVAREAGVDKVLIYRYFGGIEALLDAWGRAALGKGAVRPDGGGAGAASAETVAARAAAALLAFARSARGDPQALEIMRWELFQENALTRRLAALRESVGLDLLRQLGVDASAARSVDVPAITAVLSAGLLHVALRARTAPRWLDIPIRTAAGWERLERAAAALIRAVLSEAARDRSDAPRRGARGDARRRGDRSR